MKKLRTASFESEVVDIYETATSDFKHPLLTLVRFIFADDRPNGNNQGIEYEDFEAVKQSAIDMPIKMRLLAEAAAIGGHSAAITIGHIKGMEEDEVDGIHRLIAEGVLYADEYPKEVKFLKDAYASGKAPGASWEVNYRDEKKVGPISWLKGVVTRAATFVGNPAYGKRTQLLALASDQSITDDEFENQLKTMAQEIVPKNPDEGGSNKVEEELKKLQAELEKKNEELEALKAEKETLLTAKAELEAKVTEQDKALAEIQKAKLVAERTAKVSEAGLKFDAPEVLARKQEIWASMSEDAFAEYLTDLAAAKKVAVASDRSADGVFRSAIASGRDPLPRIDPSVGTGESLSTEDIKAQFRKLNRVQ